MQNATTQDKTEKNTVMLTMVMMVMMVMMMVMMVTMMMTMMVMVVMMMMMMRACAVEMHFNISQEELETEIDMKNVADQKLGPHCLRACAVEMHVKFLEEPLCTEISGKKAHTQSAHPDQAPAFAATVRTPQVWTHPLGKRIAHYFLNRICVILLTVIHQTVCSH